MKLLSSPAELRARLFTQRGGFIGDPAALTHSHTAPNWTQGPHSLPGVTQGDTGDKGTPAGPGTSPLAGTGWFGVPRIPCSVTTGSGRMQNVPPGMGTPLMGHQGAAEEGSLGMSWLKDL